MPAPTVMPPAHHMNASTLTHQVNGTTLWLDYSFPAFPENMGHWLEMLLPVYSQLSSGEWRAHVPPGEQATVGAVIVPNMRRGQITVGAEAGDARASGA